MVFAKQDFGFFELFHNLTGTQAEVVEIGQTFLDFVHRQPQAVAGVQEVAQHVEPDALDRRNLRSFHERGTVGTPVAGDGVLADDGAGSQVNVLLVLHHGVRRRSHRMPAERATGEGEGAFLGHRGVRRGGTMEGRSAGVFAPRLRRVCVRPVPRFVEIRQQQLPLLFFVRKLCFQFGNAAVSGAQFLPQRLNLGPQLSVAGLKLREADLQPLLGSERSAHSRWWFCFDFSLPILLLMAV